ncbi:hypothetical protein HDE_10412 [Halotydeus destructor]|nr:hypothetical protein HDE_10412 [Halotydeus destructor]
MASLTLYQKTVIWTVSTLGLLWQSFYVSEQYFKFDTVTALYNLRPVELVPPNVVTCFQKSCVVPSMQVDYDREAKVQPTAGHLLRTSLDVGHVLTKYAVHSSSNYGFEKMFSEVNKFETPFQVSKCLKMDKICYTFKLSQRFKKFRTSYLTNGFAGPKFFYAHMNGTAFASKHCSYMIWHLIPSNQSLHGPSDSYTKHNRYIANRSGYAHRNYVTIGYSAFKSILLSPPYRTNCANYEVFGFESSGQCYDECLLKLSIERLQRVPFSVMVTNSSTEYADVSRYDNYNSSFMEQLKRLEDICSGKCQQRDCVKLNYAPVIMSKEQFKEPMFELYASNVPVLESYAKSTLPFVDFITYIVSCISFWLGLNFLDLMSDISGRHLNSAKQHLWATKVHETMANKMLKYRLRLPHFGCTDHHGCPLTRAASSKLAISSIVRCQNSACNGDNGDSGTCLADTECQRREGTSVGACADGLGACCSFKFTCGGITDTNGSVFVNPSYPRGDNGTDTCQVTIEKQPTVCHLHLDLERFTLAPADENGLCTTDSFMVKTTEGELLPILCGEKAGQHIDITIGRGSANPVVLSVVTWSVASGGSTST